MTLKLDNKYQPIHNNYANDLTSKDPTYANHSEVAHLYCIISFLLIFLHWMLFCVYIEKENNVLIKLILQVVNYHHTTAILSEWGQFSDKLQNNLPKLIILLSETHYSIIIQAKSRTSSKWPLTPLYLHTSLQSQRKLVSSALTLILFQLSQQEKHYFCCCCWLDDCGTCRHGNHIPCTHVEEWSIGKVICILDTHSHKNTDTIRIQILPWDWKQMEKYKEKV